MKKELKKYITKKGGIKAILITLGILCLAGFFIVLGVVYGTYNGDWSFIGEIMTSPFAITCYVVIGLCLFMLFYFLMIYEMRKELK